jgi:hypothetical protein
MIAVVVVKAFNPGEPSSQGTQGSAGLPGTVTISGVLQAQSQFEAADILLRSYTQWRIHTRELLSG